MPQAVAHTLEQLIAQHGRGPVEAAIEAVDFARANREARGSLRREDDVALAALIRVDEALTRLDAALAASRTAFLPPRLHKTLAEVLEEAARLQATLAKARVQVKHQARRIKARPRLTRGETRRLTGPGAETRADLVQRFRRLGAGRDPARKVVSYFLLQAG
jgi:hypothetical protein